MKRLTTYLGALSLAFTAATVHAVPITDLFAGQTLDIGDKLFADWELLNVENPDAGDLDLSAIDVSTVGTGTAGDAWGLEFALSDQFSLGSDQDFGPFDFLDLYFTYSVEALDPAMLITGASMTAVGSASGDDAFFTVIKDAFAADGSSIWGDQGFLEVYDDTWLGTSLADSGAIPGLGKVWVEDNISVYYDAFFSPSAAELVSFQQRFDQSGDVPEPATLALFALGLLGFAVGRRRRVGAS